MKARSNGVSARAQHPLRVAIVGAGLMGRWHAHASRKSGGTVVAVADQDPAAARRLAGESGSVQCCMDVKELLDQVPCEVIHICTPMASHEEIASSAMESGRHVLVEKPLTPDAEGTRRLIHLAARCGVLMCPVHQFAFQDGVQKAQRLLSAIGQILHIEATFCSAGGAGRPDLELDALVAEILPHPLSLMQVFLPGHTIPENWAVVRPRHGEFRAATEIEGVTASLVVSLHARPAHCSFQILGADGTIHLDLFHGYAFMEPGSVSKARKVLRPFDLAASRFAAASVNLASRLCRHEPAYPGLTRLVTTFYDAVREGGPPPITSAAMENIARVRDILSVAKPIPDGPPCGSRAE